MSNFVTYFCSYWIVTVNEVLSSISICFCKLLYNISFLSFNPSAKITAILSSFDWVLFPAEEEEGNVEPSLFKNLS